MPEETASKLCPMCNEIINVKMGQAEIICGSCGYKF